MRADGVFVGDVDCLLACRFSTHSTGSVQEASGWHLSWHHMGHETNREQGGSVPNRDRG